jgi:hypothetical protein
MTWFHHHLPALMSSPSAIALVQGAQPILTNPFFCAMRFQGHRFLVR